MAFHVPIRAVTSSRRVVDNPAQRSGQPEIENSIIRTWVLFQVVFLHQIRVSFLVLYGNNLK